MSYNIRLDTEADGVNQWKNRTARVYDLLKKYDPDLLGVQEALPNQVEDLKENLTGYDFVGMGREDGKRKGEFSGIFYKKNRFDLKLQNTRWLSQTPDVPGSKSWDAAITRIVTYVIIKEKITGQEIAYFNTHFDHIGKEARANSAGLIKTFIAEVCRDKKMPVIVSGDFNSQPAEAPYQRMIKPDAITLYDSRPPESKAGTFCGFKVGGMDCRTLDYIFHSADWKTTAYLVIEDNNGTYYPSDHLPVMATLSR